MKSTLNQIEEIKKYGYSLDFSNVFNHAFENYKKIAIYAGLLLLIFFIISFFIGTAIFIAYYGIENLNEEFIEHLKNQQPSEKSIFIYTISITLISAILSPFTAGFLKMADCADKDETFNVSTIFTYYKSPYFSRIFTATLLIGLIGGIISIVSNLLGIILIDSLIAILISLFTSMTIPLIIFGNLNVTDAIKSSFIIVSKQVSVIIALFIVGGIASMVGFIAFCFGVIFTIPFTYSIKYAIYNAVLNIENKDSIDTIGKSELE